MLAISPNQYLEFLTQHKEFTAQERCWGCREHKPSEGGEYRKYHVLLPPAFYCKECK